MQPSASSARFGLDQLRFANSGTEATMYALRTARAFTDRKAIIKIEGGYHGGYDALQVSVKPASRTPARRTRRRRSSRSTSRPGTVHVVPYNDLPRLEQILDQHGSEVACVFMEPVLENIGIVVPDAGYLAGVRALCDRNGSLLVFDEVKTGLTAGAAGASQRLGVTPDLVSLAKSIGGGLPLAAFGGRAEVMQCITDMRMWHFGTYNGNPLVVAAAVAIDEIATPEALGAAEALNVNAMKAIDEVIGTHELPGPHGRLRREGCGDLVGDACPELPRLQAHRLRGGRAVLVVGDQPRHPDASRSRRAVAGLAGAHRRRHGPARRGVPRAGRSPARLAALQFRVVGRSAVQ